MTMNQREESGLIIAATFRLYRNNDCTWLVPSQTNRQALTSPRVATRGLGPGADPRARPGAAGTSGQEIPSRTPSTTSGPC